MLFVSTWPIILVLSNLHFRILHTPSCVPLFPNSGNFRTTLTRHDTNAHPSCDARASLFPFRRHPESFAHIVKPHVPEMNLYSLHSCITVNWPTTGAAVLKQRLPCSEGLDKNILQLNHSISSIGMKHECVKIVKP